MEIIARGSFVLALSSIVACGSDDAVPAEHDEVCGQPSPFRILELDPDLPLASVGEWMRVDGRRLLSVSYLDETQDDSFAHGGVYELWSVGECGEDPRLIGADWSFAEVDRWPDVLLTCDFTNGAVSTLDPLGERPGNVVFRTHDCRVERTPWGLIEIEPVDENTGSLVLLSYPEDPWTETAVSTVLLDPVRLRAVPPHTGPEYLEVLAVFDDDVFAIKPNDELVHVSLLDGSVTTEATGVREFEVSSDLRWIIWQDTEVTNDNVEWPEGPVYLRDREAGTTARLDNTALSVAPPLRVTSDPTRAARGDGGPCGPLPAKGRAQSGTNV